MCVFFESYRGHRDLHVLTHSCPTRRSSDLDFEDAAGFGWPVEGARFDWATPIANKDKEIDRLEGIYETLLANAGVKAYHDPARLLDPPPLEVGDHRFPAKTVPLATGGRPPFTLEPAWAPGRPATDAEAHRG